ncbi:MAG: cytochrome c maturation protein CcmE, partial [Actinomycetes bacterium]
QSASTFFYNVDEAVTQQSDLGTTRIRMQGNVVPGSVRTTPDGVAFVIKYKGAQVPVRHVGDPPELFGPQIPVVLEGAFAAGGDRFRSDEILVRHDATYDEKNEDRVREADQDAQQRASG